MAQFLQRRMGGDQEITARVHQLDAATDPAEQGLAKVVFKDAHLMADRRLGDVQLPGRAGKALQPRCGFKADQGA